MANGKMPLYLTLLVMAVLAAALLSRRVQAWTGERRGDTAEVFGELARQSARTGNPWFQHS